MMQVLTFFSRVRYLPTLVKDRNMKLWKRGLVVLGIILSFMTGGTMFLAPFLLLGIWILVTWILADDLDGYAGRRQGYDLSKKNRDRDIVDGVEFTVQDDGSDDDPEDHSS